MKSPPPRNPADFSHLPHHWVARIPRWTKPRRFQLGKNQHSRLGRPPATSALLPSQWTMDSKSPAINTHLVKCLAPQAPSPPTPRAPCTLLKQCQFATSQPSESALHTQPQWAAQTSLLERLAGPQDCYCKLMAWQLVVKNTN